MKALARCYVWWPGIDAVLESVVRQCSNCPQIRKSPPDTILHPWEWPGEAWSRIHIDYAGPIKNQMLLIIVDAYTNWIYVHITNSTSTQATVENLLQIMVFHRLWLVITEVASPVKSSKLPNIYSGKWIETHFSLPLGHA